MGGRGHFSMANRSGPNSENNLVLKTHQSQLKGGAGGLIVKHLSRFLGLDKGHLGGDT